MIKKLKEWFANFQPDPGMLIYKLPFSKRWVRYVEILCMCVFASFGYLEKLVCRLVELDIHMLVMKSFIIAIIFMGLFRATELIEYSVRKFKEERIKKQFLKQ